MMCSLGGYGDGLWWSWALVPSLFSGVLVALALWAAFRLFANSGRNGTALENGADDPAEEILRERFARGEIGADEYERSLQALREGRGQKTYEGYVQESLRKLRRPETEG